MKNNESFENDPVINNTTEKSNFKALKVLVDTQSTIRMASNRIKVLVAIQNKEELKMHTQLNTIDRIQKVRNQEQQHNARIEVRRKELERCNNQMIHRAKILKEQHLNKKEEVIQELNEERKVQYLQTEEFSEVAHRAINQNRSMYQKKKEEQRVKINQAEEQRKIKLIRYHQTRQNHIKENKMGEIELLRLKQSKKQKELSKLGNIEMELITKQSQSQAAYLQVKNKLDSLLNSVKHNHNRSKQSLKPSIYIQKNSSLP